MTNDATNNNSALRTQDIFRSRALYLIGFVTLVFTGILLLALKRSAWFITTLEIVCALSFALGFCIRARPILVNSARTTYGKGLLALYHAIVLALSSIPAKFIVSNAFHLPSGDFPITLTVWTLLCYPGMWLAGTAFVALAIYTLMLLAASLAAISTQPLFNSLLLLFAKFLPENSALRNAITTGRQRIVSQAFGHAVGAAVLSVAIGTVAGWWLQTINQPRVVRLFAYRADYEQATAYPGVDASTPFRLHDNGVVSYATFNKWDVTIHVSHIKDVK
ncbi:hypothetical protein [Burkholderia pseudomallei]|uniref:hypothetical protein n=1 Tax=Burkholderia pseudomallei TaxID=28450 RepID=UPI000A8A7E06|nr:hypothetical protein [Burkholderia pseudomallei]